MIRVYDGPIFFSKTSMCTVNGNCVSKQNNSTELRPFSGPFVGEEKELISLSNTGPVSM